MLPPAFAHTARRGSRRIAAAALAAGALLALTAPGAPALEPIPTNALQGWSATCSNVNSVKKLDAALADYFYNQTKSYCNGTTPSGYTTTPHKAYGSYAVFAADAANGRIPPGVKVIMYDPEKWDSTPLAEQRDPAQYARRFAELAHQKGYRASVHPGRSLASVDGSLFCTRRSGESGTEAFIRCNFAGMYAKSFDAISVQMQAHENDPAYYRSTVQRLAGQARSANSTIEFFSNLSSSPGYTATGPMLFEAWKSVRGIVHGHHLNIPGSGEEPPVVDFLRRVRAEEATTRDTVKPTTSIGAPAAAATVTGTVTVSAAASDNVGVTRVEFLVDGVVRASDPTNPYTLMLDTTQLADGVHSLQTTAHDAAGNVGTSATVTVTVANAAPPPTSSALGWFLAGSQLSDMRAQSPELSAHFLNQPKAYIIGNEDGTQNQVPTGWSATPTLEYESYTRFASDTSAGRISSQIKAVAYDPQNWSATPDAEKKDPTTYMAKFHSLAKSRGYYVIQAPARDLMQVSGGKCVKRSGESLSDAYVRCRVAEHAARNADLYVFQSQVLEKDPSTFRKYISLTRDQAKAAKPSVVYFGSLSTRPYDYVATSQMLYDAHASAKDLVEGYKLSVQGGEESIALGFLSKLKAVGYGP